MLKDRRGRIRGGSDPSDEPPKGYLAAAISTSISACVRRLRLPVPRFIPASVSLISAAALRMARMLGA